MSPPNTMIRHRSMLSRWLLCLCLATAWLPASAQEARRTPALIPIPAQMQSLPGEYRPGDRIDIGLSDPADRELRELGKLAADIVGHAWNKPASVKDSASADVKLRLEPDPKANPESYRLRVDADGIELDAPTHAGLFYGLQTLRQLAVPGSKGIAALRIEDEPRFGYRGMMLDVGRHVFPLEFIKRHIDLMARYKFNIFHWHLTEDQGWRLEIKRYPRLTSVGAWRKETQVGHYNENFVGDGKPYGGFYTQAQARELVAYAAERHVTIIPEIELPGHAVAALAAYSELACTPGPFEVRTRWGIDDNVLCPSEQTFEFVTNVLDEVMDIFPSKYIHLGGDEAPTVRWKESKLAQDIIRREKLADEHALQGWFLRRVEDHVTARGRRIIGWDEILDGDPSPTATVMSWRGMEGGIRAAQAGRDVIMAPTSHAYFDYCQADPAQEPLPCWGGRVSLRQAYRFEPVPDVLTAAQATHILGGQANLWTEHIKTPEHAEYMLWPRAFAMAEVLWSPRDQRDWDSFLRRLGPQFATLDRLGVGYRIPEVAGLEDDMLLLEPQVRLQLFSPVDGALIRYTTDGSEPQAQSPRYDGPIDLPISAQGTRVSARLFLPDGRIGPVAAATFTHGTLRPATKPKAALEPGLQRGYYEAARMRSAADVEGLTATRSGTAMQVAIPDDARAEHFGLRFTGLLRVPADGVYRFLLGSDDGALLQVDGRTVVDRDGEQTGDASSGSIALAAGLHTVVLRYFQGWSAKGLDLKIATGDGLPTPVPQDWWWHRP